MTVVESILPTADDEWCLEKHELHGHLFWQRRDSSNSRVKFKHDVEVLEFERDPEEECLISRGEFSHMFSERRQANPIVVISTIACAFAVTILLPWFMIQASEPME